MPGEQAAKDFVVRGSNKSKSPLELLERAFVK